MSDLSGATSVYHDREKENEVFDGSRNVQPSDVQIVIIDEEHAEWDVQKA